MTVATLVSQAKFWGGKAQLSCWMTARSQGGSHTSANRRLGGELRLKVYSGRSA